MTRKQKIEKIREACIAVHPGLAAQQQLRLRHVLKVFHVKKLKYMVGAGGYFVDPVSLTATHARWLALNNDLNLQDDPCVDFLYQLFQSVSDRDLPR